VENRKKGVTERECATNSNGKGNWGLREAEGNTVKSKPKGRE